MKYCLGLMLLFLIQLFFFVFGKYRGIVKKGEKEL